MMESKKNKEECSEEQIDTTNYLKFYKDNIMAKIKECKRCISEERAGTAMGGTETNFMQSLNDLMNDLQKHAAEFYKHLLTGKTIEYSDVVGDLLTTVIKTGNLGFNYEQQDTDNIFS
jgi:hypothetical protein